MERPARIRELVRSAFCQMGAQQAQPVMETLLIRDGHYCGHRYETKDLTAIWFLEEGQLKFYNSEGRTVRVDSMDVPQPAAKAA